MYPPRPPKASAWEPREEYPAEKVYSVPRRFDLATLLTVSLAYSLLFALLKSLGAPWGVYLFIGGLTVVVGCAQAMTDHSAQVRRASIIAGGVYCGLAGGLVALLFNGVEMMVPALFFAAIPGLGLGYLAGALDGGLFLIADIVRRHWPGEQGDESPVGDDPLGGERAETTSLAPTPGEPSVD